MTLSRFSDVAARFRGRVKRTLLGAPGLKQWSDHAYYAALGRHAERLPATAHPLPEVLSSLRRERVVCTDGAAWVPPDVHAEALELCQLLAGDKSARSTVEAGTADLARRQRLFLWGLAHENLDLAECYIGLPVHFLGVSVKREKADARAVDIRCWHRDVEDRRMLKLVIYLGAVGVDDGPLEYLDRVDTRQAIDRLGYRSGFVSDRRMAQAVPPGRWQAVTGPALTATVLDTCRLFHRARPPRRHDRYSMTFSYCSTRPHQLFPEYLPSRDLVASLAAQLCSRQRAAAISR
jgi:hypothetical protein